MHSFFIGEYLILIFLCILLNVALFIIWLAALSPSFTSNIVKVSLILRNSFVQFNPATADEVIGSGGKKGSRVFFSICEIIFL